MRFGVTLRQIREVNVVFPLRELPFFSLTLHHKHQIVLYVHTRSAAACNYHSQGLRLAVNKHHRMAADTDSYSSPP